MNVNKPIRVVVLHRFYGCDSGCCGHTVRLAADDHKDFGFEFEHPYGRDAREWALSFAQSAVEQTYGQDHVADLDWVNSVVSDD